MKKYIFIIFILLASTGFGQVIRPYVNAGYLGGVPASSYLLSATAASTYYPLTGGLLNGDMYLLQGYKMGIGTLTPKHSFVSVLSNATGLYGLNLVNSDYNKNRSTYAQAVDSSSFNLSFTPLGKPFLSMNSPTGVANFAIDSLGYLRLSGNILLLNKAGTGYITPFTRNTSGSEAVYDLTNVGNIAGSSLSFNNGYIDVANFELYSGLLKMRNKVNSNWITFGTQNTSGSETVLDLSNIGTVKSAIFKSTSGTTPVNYVQIDSTNSLRMYGTSTVWDDLMVPFTTGHRGNNSTPSFSADSNWFSFSGGSDSTTYVMYMCIQLPHSYKEGSTVYPHIHYHHTTAQGTPTFRIKYKWSNIGGTTGTWKYYTLSTPTATTNLTQQLIGNSTGISGSGKTISSILICQIYLVSQTGTGGIDAYQADVHFEQDCIGSNSETTK